MSEFADQLYSRKIKPVNATSGTAAPGTGRRAGQYRLSEADCLERLPTAVIGRLVYTKAGKPATWLTKFKLENGSITFTTSQAEVLLAATRGYVAAFEANAVDNRQRRRWAVTVVGHLSLVPTVEVTGPKPPADYPAPQMIRLVIAAAQGDGEAL